MAFHCNNCYIRLLEVRSRRQKIHKTPGKTIENLEWGERVTKSARLFQLCFATRQLVMMLVPVTGARSLAFSWQIGRA